MFSKLLRKSHPQAARPTRFRMEQLETRQMMAGDLAAYVYNGNLYINEATGQGGLDNGVRVVQVSPGVVRVMGAEANASDGSLSRINGAAYQDFAVPGDLFVNLGAGNDRLHLGFGDGSAAPQFNNISVNMGAPDLVIAQKSLLKAGVDTVFDPPDEDQVMAWGFSSRGNTTFNTGIGNDWVYVGRGYVGDGMGADKLTINTGAGADTASIKGTTILGNLLVQTYANASENDADMIWIDSNFDSNFNVVPTYITGNSELYTGGGADIVAIGDKWDDYFLGLGLKTLGSMHVSTGAGDDMIDVRAAMFGDANHWSNLSIYSGAGADDIRVDFDRSLIDYGNPMPELTGQLFISAGAASENDADIVNIPIGQIWNSVYIYLGGGDDQFTLTAGNWGNYLTIDAGAGNDTGYVAGFLWNNAEIRMGDGNDNLTLGHLRASQLRLDGGNGVDSLRRLSPSAVDQLFQTGWEYINGRPIWMLDQVFTPTSGVLARA